MKQVYEKFANAPINKVTQKRFKNKKNLPNLKKSA